MSVSAFKQATEFVKRLPKDGDVKLSNDDKLRFYALFKQATVGKCSKNGGSQPWAMKVEARAKWDAWNALGDMNPKDAATEYVNALTKKTANSKAHKFVVKQDGCRSYSFSGSASFD